MAQIVIKNFEQEIFVFETTIFEDFLLECKILNSRVVENIFPEKLNCDLWKSKHVWKIDKKR